MNNDNSWVGWGDWGDDAKEDRTIWTETSNIQHPTCHWIKYNSSYRWSLFAWIRNMKHPRMKSLVGSIEWIDNEDAHVEIL